MMSENENFSPEPEEETEEFGHTDKITGVFTEPGDTFTKMAGEPPKVIDWLLPLIILLITIVASSAIVLNNPAIRADVKEKAFEKQEKNIQEMVKNGTLSQTQAEEQMARVEKQLEMIGSPMGLLFQAITIIIIGFLVFFLVAGVHLGFMKALFKSVITYKQTLAANGLVAYISIVMVIVTTILSLALGRGLQSASLAAFMNLEDGSIMKVLAAKVDPLTIWAYTVLGIGYARLSKTENAVKYIGLVFGIWIGWSIIWHYVSQAVPFLRAFGG